MAAGALKHLAFDGAEIAVRVTPKAARNRIAEDEHGGLRIWVTTVPENGKANASVVKLLAKALGVPKTRLELVHGATSRDKRFRVNS